MLRKLVCGLLMLLPLIGNAEECPHYQVDEITTEELLSWYEQKIPMVVLDARGRRFFDGRSLPGAIWISCSAPDDVVLQGVPDKNSLIVVYCSNIDCPASNWLAGRLLKFGYQHVYEYPNGIDGWVEEGHPTELKAKS